MKTADISLELLITGKAYIKPVLYQDRVGKIVIPNIYMIIIYVSSLLVWERKDVPLGYRQ